MKSFSKTCLFFAVCVGSFATICSALSAPSPSNDEFKRPYLNARDSEAPNESNDFVIVETTLGPVRGWWEMQEDVPLYAFRGIPFGQPPVDELRFMAPLPATPWEGTFDANSTRDGCIQSFSGTGREDCLYLDIFVPESIVNATEPFATIVYIYGGAFLIGNNGPYGEVFPLLRQDLIVILPQYRVGVLGFLSTEDAVAPGNQGLMDQTLSLQWIFDNIVAFGGDQARITAMGTSAGSASSMFQMMVSSAAGLISGVILHSGTVIAPWATGRDFLQSAEIIADRFNCSTATSQEIITCLQGVNGRLLEESLSLTTVWNGQPFCFGPRADGVYIEDNPAVLLQEGRFAHVPVLLGNVRDEGSLESTEMYFRPNLIEKLEADFETNGPVSLMLYPDEDPLNTAYAIYDYYINGNITEDQADNLTRLYTDLHFHMPTDRTLDLIATQVPVYVQELHHRGEQGYTNRFLNQGLNITAAENWVSHGDDIQYLLRWADGLTLEDDIAVSNVYAELWANFAKFGNPTPTEDNIAGFIWPPATPDDSRQIMRIVPSPELIPYYRRTTRNFWDTLPLRINAILAGGR
jgi:carboxylesterase type B